MLIDSVSINISLMGTCWADLIVDALRQRLLAHGDARAPLCMHSMSDGRRQLGPLLSLAQAELHALSPALLLPEGLGLPRTVRMRLPPSSAIGLSDGLSSDGTAHPTTIKRGTRFARSPLAVLIRLPETAPGASNDDEEDDDEEEEDEEEDEEEEEEEEEEEGKEAKGADKGKGGEYEGEGVRRGKGGGLGMGRGGGYEEGEDGAEASLGSQEKGGGRLLPTRCGGHERLTGASDLFVDTCAAASASDAIFVVHSHFGHEELGSLLRLELCTPVALVPLMEWLRTAPSNFSARQAWRGANSEGARPDGALLKVRFKTVAAVLQILERHGYCVFA